MPQFTIEDLDPVLLEKLSEVEKQVLAQKKTPEELGWTPGFFERTAGAWEGEPLTRDEQGEFEERLWELL